MDLIEDVEAAAPTRFDLAGGTVDLWPLYLFHREAVTVNAAVNLVARVQVERSKSRGVRLLDLEGGREIMIRAKCADRKLGDYYALFRQVLQQFSIKDGVVVRYRCEAPRGAGLAGSSALLAAVCGALMKGGGRVLSKERFLWLLRDLETKIIRAPAGMQDYYPAVWGGVQALWWSAGGMRREKLTFSASELEKRILLVYTGRSRNSGTNNWAVFKRHLDGDKKVLRYMEEIVAAARSVVRAIQKGDFRTVGRAMAAEFEARKRLFPGITTPEIRALESAMKGEGAVAVKVCGAGGGGCVLVYADPERKDLLAEAARKGGYVPLPFRIARRGLICRTGRSRALS